MQIWVTRGVKESNKVLYGPSMTPKASESSKMSDFWLNINYTQSDIENPKNLEKLKAQKLVKIKHQKVNQKPLSSQSKRATPKPVTSKCKIPIKC